MKIYDVDEIGHDVLIINVGEVVIPDGAGPTDFDVGRGSIPHKANAVFGCKTIGFFQSDAEGIVAFGQAAQVPPAEGIGFDLIGLVA